MEFFRKFEEASVAGDSGVASQVSVAIPLPSRVLALVLLVYRESSFVSCHIYLFGPCWCIVSLVICCHIYFFGPD